MSGNVGRLRRPGRVPNWVPRGGFAIAVELTQSRSRTRVCGSGRDVGELNCLIRPIYCQNGSPLYKTSTLLHFIRGGLVGAFAHPTPVVLRTSEQSQDRIQGKVIMFNHPPLTRVTSICTPILLSYMATAAVAGEQTELISVRSPVITSETPSGVSYVSSRHSLSRTGRFAVFFSQANDVLSNQDNHQPTHIFVRDRQAGTTTQVIVSPSAIYIDQPSISDDGRYIAFVGYGDVLGNGETAFTERVYAMDLQTRAIEKVTVGVGNTLPNAESFDPMISGNGRYVVFTSRASNLVTNDTNDASDIFETDLSSHTTRRVSLNTSGRQLNGDSQFPFVSSDGRYVVYASRALNASTIPGYVPDAVLLYDRTTGITELSSRNAKGLPANLGADMPSVSDDGHYVAFASQGTNLVSGTPSNWSQVFVRDRVARTLLCASISSTGDIGNFNSYFPIINGAGTAIVFGSTSSNLAPNDANGGTAQTFVHSLITGATTRASVSSNGTPALAPAAESPGLSISGDGNWVAFHTAAANLVPGDLNNASDVFAHQVLPRTIIRVNAGGSSYIDSVGRVWQSDRGFNTGIASHTTATITGTPNPGLYQSQRYDAAGGPELRYQFTVPNGTYIVRLHFAENYEPNFHRGARLFNVDVEGVRVFSNLDIYARAGGHAALVLEAQATVIDGELHIDFHHEVQNPQVNAIEIVGQ